MRPPALATNRARLSPFAACSAMRRPQGLIGIVAHRSSRPAPSRLVASVSSALNRSASVASAGKLHALVEIVERKIARTIARHFDVVAEIFQQPVDASALGVIEAF